MLEGLEDIGLYKLPVRTTDSPHALPGESNSVLAEIWHARFSHLHSLKFGSSG